MSELFNLNEALKEVTQPEGFVRWHNVARVRKYKSKFRKEIDKRKARIKRQKKRGLTKS